MLVFPAAGQAQELLDELRALRTIVEELRAEAANCAGEQGKYWEMRDQFFEHARALSPDALPRHAAAVGLDMALFANCLASGRYSAEVRQDYTDGFAAGVTGTPTFFLAVAGDEPGTVRTLTRILGAQPYSVFKGAIDEALAGLAKNGQAG